MQTLDSVMTITAAWRSPSNIALVKYWGKKDIQIPCNPSISFTLDASHTDTRLEYTPGNESLVFELYLDGVRNEKFEAKTGKFVHEMATRLPFLKTGKLTAHTSNTFPHSAGIASSASGMSAMALGLCDIHRQLTGALQNEDAFLAEASEIARLGSGSACRSTYGGLVVWGKTPALEGSSDLYGKPLAEADVHPVFRNYRDSILIVDAAEKKVSSRAGHGLMNTNPFSEQRFAQAERHLVELVNAIQAGDMETFIRITELEALTLHAMMMTSTPYYLLMRPHTLSIIEKIWEFREKTGIPVCFTLDAGPNVHMLYPEQYAAEVGAFLETELFVFLPQGNKIEDRNGNGPVQLTNLHA